MVFAIPSAVEAAYRRGDLFEKRRLLMNDWAAFLDPDNITVAVPIILVVRSEFLRMGDEFLIDRVHDPALDTHDHRLVTSRADDHTL